MPMPIHVRLLLALTLAASLVLGVTAAGRPQEGEKKDAGAPPAAGLQRRTYAFKDAGKEMEYGLFVPAKCDPKVKTPLVVALHGLGSNAMQILRYPGLTAQAEKYGFLVA